MIKKQLKQITVLTSIMTLKNRTKATEISVAFYVI